MKITIEISSVEEAQKVLDLLAGSGEDPPANTARSRKPKSKPEPADPPAEKPKAKTSEDDEGKTFTKDDVSRAFKKFAKSDRAGAIMIMKKFDAAKVGDIDPSRYAEVMTELGFA